MGEIGAGFAHMLGPLCALLSSVTWAVGTAAYSRLTKTYSAFAINFTRTSIGMPCFFICTVLVSGGLNGAFERYAQLQGETWGWFVLSVIASYGLGDSVFLLSARRLGVPSALAIGSCYPLWTVLVGRFYLHEILSPLQLVGIVVTLLGIIIVVLNRPDRLQKEFGHRISWVGLCLAVVASIAWATNSFAANRGGYGVEPWVANTVRMGMGFFLAPFFGRIFEPAQRISLPFFEVRKLFLIFVFEAFLGSLLFLYGVSHSPLALGTTLSSLSPVLAVPVAVFLGLEKFSLVRTLGVTLSVTGVILIMSSF